MSTNTAITQWADLNRAGVWTNSYLLTPDGQTIGECWPTYGRVGWMADDGSTGVADSRREAKKLVRSSNAA